MIVHLAVLTSFLVLNCDAKPRGDRDQHLFPANDHGDQIAKPLESDQQRNDDDLKRLEDEYVNVEEGKVRRVTEIK